MNSRIVIPLLLLQLVVATRALEECDEMIPDSPMCDEHEDSCTSPSKRALCQRYCGICGDGNSKTIQTTAPTNLSKSKSVCVDKSILCQYRIRSCGTPKVNDACPETCGLCFRSNRAHTQGSTTARATQRKTTTQSTKKITPTTTVRPTTRTSSKPTRKSTPTTKRTTVSTTKQTPKRTTVRSTPMQRTTMATATRKPSCTNFIGTVECERRKSQCDTSTYISIACPKTCYNCNPPPPRYVTAKPKTDVKTIKAEPLLVQQPKSAASSDPAVKSCVDMTKFLCPMLSCMTDNSEFKKLCEQQSVYICDQ